MGRRLLLAGWYAVALILVLTAVLNSVTRLPSSWYQEYLPAFQENISSIVGKPVRIEAIRMSWYDYTPLLSVDGLSVYSNDTKSTRLLFAEEALISLNLLGSLINKKFVIQELQLIGCNLEAVRKKDQRIVLNGIDFSERIASRKELGKVSDIRFSLLASTIAIKDEILERDYHFDRVDIVLRFHEEKLKISSRVVLPDMLGDSLLLGVNLEGLDQGLNSIKGMLYTKGENINLELLGDFFPQLQLGIHNGRSDFEVWGDLESKHTWSFQGRLAFHDIEYRPVADLKVHDGQEITALDTQFRIQKSRDTWHLALIESDIRSAGQKWAGEEYEIRCTRCEGDAGESAVAVSLEYFNSSDLLATLQHFPNFSKRLKSFSPEIQIVGELTNTQVQFQLHDEQIVKYTYSTIFQDVTVSVPSHELEISFLSGEAAGNHLHGRFVVNSPSVQIRAHRLKAHTFPDQKITGQLKWEFTGHGTVVALENILLEAEGLHASLQGVVRMEQGRSSVDIQARFPKVQIAALDAWLPFKKLDPELVRWFVESERQGSLNDVRLLLKGDPKRIPFKDHPGRLEVYADIKEASLSPHEQWPGIHNVAAHMEIRNQQLHIHGDRGQIFNSSILGFDIAIDDVLWPRLVMEANIRGSASDILNFLEKSPMIPQYAQMPAKISLEGMVNLGLNLVFPLTDKLEEERRVEGMIEFSDTDLTLGLASLQFTDLNGKLKFSHAGIESEGVSARLYGSEFHAGALLLEDGGTRVRIQGKLDIDAWLAANHFRVGQRVRGKAPVSATIDLPQFGNEVQEEPLEISVESDLLDVSLAFPEPFGKKAGMPSTLSIRSRFHIGRNNILLFNYKNRVFAQGLLDADEGQLSALEIRVGDDRFDLPLHGIKVSGKFDRLDVAQWLNLFEPTDTEDSLELHEVDVWASKISLSGLTFTDIDLSLRKDVKSWAGKVHSHTVSGKFEYPLELDAESIVTARLEYFRFDQPEEDFTFAVNPRDFPALDIHIKRLELNDLLVSNVTLRTHPSAQGMVIDSLAAEEDSYRLETNGAWDLDINGVHSTDIAITLTARDLHDVLTGFGLEPGVNKGKGVVSARLSWPDMPYQFSLDSFVGTATLRLKDGEITTVDPGAGRLVGLFNLAEISRRLTLDFSDFFSEGYVFDKIRGNLVFKDGNLTTEDLQFEGPSADMEIAGRTGIVARDYDQIITVTPHVTGGLPWLGIGLGPVGVGGIYILGKIGEKVGIDVDKVVDKIVEVKYHMTGSWENPEIEPVAQKIADSESPPQSP